MRASSIRLSRRHQWMVYVIGLGIFGTGTIWAVLHYLTAPNEYGPSAAETWFLKAHGAAGMLVLVLLGTLLPTHIALAWRASRNLRTGVSLLAFVLFLAATGYGLYYAGGESLRAWLGQTHLWGGLLVAPIMILHVWFGKRRSPK